MISKKKLTGALTITPKKFYTIGRYLFFMGGVIGLIVAPMIAVIAMGPFKAFMMSFTVGSFTLSGAGYLAGAFIQSKLSK